MEYARASAVIWGHSGACRPHAGAQRFTARD